MSDRSGRKQASAEAWSDCARCGMADANCWAQISASNAECCSACSHSLTPSVQATGPLPLPPGHVIHRLPADAKCGCTPACRHAFYGDMGGLDSDYDHCEVCGGHWPCQHAKGQVRHV